MAHSVDMAARFHGSINVVEEPNKVKICCLTKTQT